MWYSGWGRARCRPARSRSTPGPTPAACPGSSASSSRRSRSSQTRSETTRRPAPSRATGSSPPWFSTGRHATDVWRCTTHGEGDYCLLLLVESYCYRFKTFLNAHLWLWASVACTFITYCRTLSNTGYMSAAGCVWSPSPCSRSWRRWRCWPPRPTSLLNRE